MISTWLPMAIPFVFIFLFGAYEVRQLMRSFPH